MRVRSRLIAGTQLHLNEYNLATAAFGRDLAQLAK